MQNKHNFVAVNTTLCDVRKSDALFDDIFVVINKNFAQTTSVVSRENRIAQINVNIRNFWIWTKLKILHLIRNMRVIMKNNNRAFANWIDRMSYDVSLYERIQLLFMINANYERSRDFIDHVFSSSQLALTANNSSFFQSRVILCSHNDSVKLFNDQILQKLSNVERIFFSFDTVTFEIEIKSFELSVEYLQSLNSFDFFSSQLTLKIDASIMLLRNLHSRESMCNETRLIITRLHRDCIEDRILDDAWNDQRRFISRIKLISKEDDYF